MGIKLKLPHVNESDADFKIEGKGIRFGLTSVKWISDTIASRLIEKRPFSSYEELKNIALAKGTGINTRAIEALNAIGGATFPDNPRDEERVRSNLYEYLNLPEFNVSIPQHYYAFIDDLEEFDETKSHIIMGMAKKIKRAKGWCRIEFMDKTGMVGIFDEEDSLIETGKTYLVLASSNRIAKAVAVDDLKINNDTALLKYLSYKKIPYGQDEYFVLSFNPRVTKKGDKMAHITLVDYDRNIIPIVAFPKSFAQAYMKCEEGKIIKPQLNKLKDGTLAFEGIKID